MDEKQGGNPTLGYVRIPGRYSKLCHVKTMLRKDKNVKIFLTNVNGESNVGMYTRRTLWT